MPDLAQTATLMDRGVTTRAACRQAGGELRPCELVRIYRDQQHLPDSLLLTQIGGSGGWFVAIDDDSAVAAKVCCAGVFYLDVDGIAVPAAWIEPSRIDDAVAALLASGCHVAVAVAIDDPDPLTGVAPTAVVRNLRAKVLSENTPPATPGDLEFCQRIAKRIADRLAALRPELCEIVTRSTVNWLDGIAARQEVDGSVGLFPDVDGSEPCDWSTLADVSAAIAGLSEEDQRRVVSMVHRSCQVMPSRRALRPRQTRELAAAAAPVLRVAFCEE